MGDHVGVVGGAALTQNENLTTVTITLWAPGTTTPEATIKLTNANIVDHSQDGTTESISFTYQKITWTWMDGDITSEDDWEAPVS